MLTQLTPNPNVPHTLCADVCGVVVAISSGAVLATVLLHAGGAALNPDQLRELAGVLNQAADILQLEDLS